MKISETKAGRWIDNFWYHYKWEVIIFACIIVILAVLIPQFITRESYDVSVMYTGPVFLDADQNAAIESSFRQISKNESGEKSTIQLIDMPAFTSKQAKELVDAGKYSFSMLSPHTENNMSNSFQTQIFAGEASICLLDSYWYEIVKNAGGFVPLSEILGYTPENMIDEYSIYLKDTDFGKYFSALDVLPEDTILCMRLMTTASAFLGKNKTEASYEASKQLFKNIFEFKLPEGFSEETAA